MKNRSEIVKYPPWNYVNGCYTKDECDASSSHKNNNQRPYNKKK